MNPPSKKVLWFLMAALIVLAVSDVLLTTVGLLFFNGEEGNPLIVWLAERLFSGTSDVRVIGAVWLSKGAVLAAVLYAVHMAVKSEPVRDDWVMAIGLSASLLVYVGVVGSWIWFFTL